MGLAFECGRECLVDSLDNVHATFPVSQTSVTPSATRVVFFALTLLYLLLLPAFGQTTSSPVIYRERLAFHSITRPGTIAFLPSSSRDGDAKYMITFWALEDSRYYQLPTRGSYGFVVNIHDPTAEMASFLAITIVEVLPPNAVDEAWTALSRSPGNWLRKDDPAFRPFPRQFQDSMMTFNDIKTWHTNLLSIAEFDSALKNKTARAFSWHAQPLDCETSSWDARTILFGPASNTDLSVLLPQWFADLPTDYKLRVSTRLTRFIPTSTIVPKLPMDFYFNYCGAIRAAIITKCPDYPGLDRVVLLKLD